MREEPEVKTSKADWEIVIHDEGEGSDRAVRRLPVPGGWLYQVSMDNLSVADNDGWATRQHGWSPPVFVPAPVHDYEAVIRRPPSVSDDDLPKLRTLSGEVKSAFAHYVDGSGRAAFALAEIVPMLVDDLQKLRMTLRSKA